MVAVGTAFCIHSQMIRVRDKIQVPAIPVVMYYLMKSEEGQTT